LPSIATDTATPGSFYTDAILAAMNLPDWAGAIARYARAAANEQHKAKVERFFIDLGKALKSRRTLWDATDEFIAYNWDTTDKFKKPLSQMTEDEGAKCVQLSLAAYDKRLQRLRLIRKGGRPRKQDKSSKRRS
jgi:hypothetical protein